MCALFSRAHTEGKDGGATHLWKIVHVGCYQHLLNISI